LTLKGNKCAHTDKEMSATSHGYRLYVIAFLDRLQYLDYQLIQTAEWTEANDKHEEEIKEENNKISALIDDSGNSEYTKEKYE